MKFNRLSILAGAIALSLTAAPFSANAKPVQQLAQAQQQPSVAPPPQIQLNAKQQEQVKKINADVRKQIDTVLSPTQRTQLRKSLQARRNPQEITQDLKLTQDQGRRLQQIVAASQKKIFETVLTPQQQNQIRQYYQSQNGGRPR
jgi:periplasmic protein CpxP/Spy